MRHALQPPQNAPHRQKRGGFARGPGRLRWQWQRPHQPARPGPQQQNVLRQMQPKSVSAPARCPSPQKARVLIDAFTRGLLAGGSG